MTSGKANPKAPATLLQWRERCGFSQEQAARFFEVSQPVYCRLEAGRYVHPSRDVLLRVHRETGVSYESLLLGPKSPKRDDSRADAEAVA